MLAKLCNQGFDDALNFLQNKNLINCKQCIIRRSTWTLSENNVDAIAGHDSSCIDCQWDNAVIC